MLKRHATTFFACLLLTACFALRPPLVQAEVSTPRPEDTVKSPAPSEAAADAAAAPVSDPSEQPQTQPEEEPVEDAQSAVDESEPLDQEPARSTARELLTSIEDSAGVDWSLVSLGVR